MEECDDLVLFVNGKVTKKEMFWGALMTLICRRKAGPNQPLPVNVTASIFEVRTKLNRDQVEL